MADSLPSLITKVGVTAASAYLLGGPLSNTCQFFLGALLATELGDAARKEVDEVGKKLAEALGEYGFLQLKPKEPGGLAEAFSEALRLSLLELQDQQKDHEHFPQWEPLFNSWTQALRDFNGYYAEGIENLGRELHHLQNAPTNWSQLPELLSLLDFATRLRGNPSAPQEALPAPLAHILIVEAAPLFLQHFRKLLTDEKYKPALVAIALDAHARAPHGATTPTPILLTGPTDPRLQPMRGHFVGRADKIAEIHAFLSQPSVSKILNVQGAPGQGKTECCKAALRLFLTESSPTRALFVDATEAQSERGLLARIAAALGDENLATDPEKLYARLTHSADLLYLDNLEDALPGDHTQSEALFRVLERLALSGLRVLASCRVKLGSVALELPLGPLPATDALAVFRFHFAADTPNLGDDPHLARFLAEQLDHHPLALRLVASQADPGTPWTALAEAWRTQRTAMANDEGRAGRLSNLDVSIALSYNRLAHFPIARTLWLALTCFAEGMRPAAQIHLLPDPKEREAAIRILKRYGLLETSGDRLRMLAPLRQFARANCTEELPLIEDACFAYFLEVARRAKETEFGDHQDRASRVAAIMDELPNIAEAVPNFQPSAKTLSRLISLHSQLRNSYQVRAFASITFLEYMAQTLAPSDLGRANALHALGDIECLLGQTQLARQNYTTALKLYEKEGNNLGCANTLRSMGSLESRLGEPALALQLYNDALDLYVDENENTGHANALQALGDLECRIGQLDLARQHYSDALQLFVTAQNKIGRASTLLSLGDLEIRLGQPELARQNYDDALQLYVHEKSNLGQASTLKAIGELESECGQMVLAEQHYNAALQLYVTEQNILGRANTLKCLGDLEWRLNNSIKARQHYDSALALYASENFNLGRANTLKSISLVTLDEGLVEEGCLTTLEALNLYVREKVPSGQAECLAIIATLLYKGNQLEMAQQSARLAREAASASKVPATVEWVNNVLQSVCL